MNLQAALSLILTTSISFASPGETPGAFISHGYDDARALAHKEGKLLMIDFFTTWCGPCKKLDAVTWPDPRVQRWLLENVVAIKIDADRDGRTKTLYQVDLYPSLVFMTPDGLELDRLKGFLAPEQFLGSARMLVAAAQNGNHLAQQATGPQHLVPKARLAYANYLAGTKRYRAAAEHYLWCFDEGIKHDPSFAATRRGEVIDSLQLLARNWVRGKGELRKRRDAANVRLLSEAGDLNDALDVAALNVALADKSKTLATYLVLIGRDDEASAAKAAGLLDSIFDQLIGPKRYSNIAACLPDFPGRLDASLAELEQLRAQFKGVERAQLMLDSELSAIVARGTLYFEVLLATGQEESAQVLGARLTALDPLARTYLALARRSKRTGDRKTALSWAMLGLKEVPEAQNASLTVMVHSLERELESAAR